MEHSNPFTRDTYPNLFEHSSVGSAYHHGRAASLALGKDLFPAPDRRYPAFAAAINDGRLVTDYRPQCTKNIPVGDQFHTKKWMIQNGEALMEEARKRQVERTGAAIPTIDTSPLPAGIVHSTPFQSEIHPTNWKGGLGVERADSKAPALFGTFQYEPTISERQANRKNIAMTTREEGGRNSKRGTFRG